MGQAQLSYLSEANYLAGEELPGLRHEYVQGEIYAMTGASKTHGIIAGNVFALLRTHLRGSPCRTWTADMKVQVASVSAYYYPDVVVTCSPQDLAADAPKNYLTAPQVIVEVLSASTEQVDRREKWLNYRQLDSLREYVLIDQERQWAEVFHRGAEGWLHEICQAGETLSLQSLDLQLAMDEIYEDSKVPREAVCEFNPKEPR